MDWHSVGIVAVVACVTALTRFLPFWVWGGERKTPRWVLKLGRALPSAIMGMLVVYCLKGVDATRLSGILPEVISCGVVVALHLWRRNTLISILGGTVCYMFLVQVIFG